MRARATVFPTDPAFPGVALPSTVLSPLPLGTQLLGQNNGVSLSLTTCWSLRPQVVGWSHQLGAGISSRIVTWTGQMLDHHLTQRAWCDTTVRTVDHYTLYILYCLTVHSHTLSTPHIYCTLYLLCTLCVHLTQTSLLFTTHSLSYSYTC